MLRSRAAVDRLIESRQDLREVLSDDETHEQVRPWLEDVEPVEQSLYTL